MKHYEDLPRAGEQQTVDGVTYTCVLVEQYEHRRWAIVHWSYSSVSPDLEGVYRALPAKTEATRQIK